MLCMYFVTRRESDDIRVGLTSLNALLTSQVILDMNPLNIRAKLFCRDKNRLERPDFPKVCRDGLGGNYHYEYSTS